MKKFYISLFLLAVSSMLNAQDFRFGKVSKEEVQEKQHPVYKDANAAILYKEQRTYYEVSSTTGFTLITDVFERIKIYNKDGFDWATKEITSYQNGSTQEEVASIKAYTYNIVDGKLVDEKLHNREVYKEEVTKYRNKTRFTMPAVTEGSVIEIRYSVRSPFLTDIDDIALQYTIPLNHFELKVKIPEFLNFQQRFNPKSPVLFDLETGKDNFTYNYTSNQRRTDNNYVVRNSIQNNKVEYLQKVYELKKENIPPLKQEVFVDYLQNYAAYLKWELQYTKFPNSPIESYTTTWEAVTKSIYHDSGYENELSHTNYFKDEVDQLISGATSPVKKAELIYNFVKDRVKWNNYAGFRPENGLKSAFKDGEGNVGDINLLLIAMLKYVGLDVHPVLTSTPDNGIPIFPTQKGFNYVLAGLKMKNNLILLDATELTAAFGELPERARNWQGRIIADHGGSEWVPLIPTQKSGKYSSLNLMFEEDLSLKGRSTDVLSGLYAKHYRDRYMGVDEESYLDELKKGRGEIEISDLKTANREVVGADIKESYAFHLRDAVEVIGDKIYIKPLLFLALKENPFKADERYYPIFFDYPSTSNKIVNLMLPKGYKVESMPENYAVQLNGGSGKFTFLANQNGQFLRIQSLRDINGIVYPAQDYENLKKFYSEIVDKQNEVIVLSKSTDQKETK